MRRTNRKVENVFGPIYVLFLRVIAPAIPAVVGPLFSVGGGCNCGFDLVPNRFGLAVGGAPDVPISHVRYLY